MARTAPLDAVSILSVLQFSFRLPRHTGKLRGSGSELGNEGSDIDDGSTSLETLLRLCLVLQVRPYSNIHEWNKNLEVEENSRSSWQ
jgi:hypothetical protein